MLQLLCRAGFNLLFYGAGSKRKLLNHFAQQALTDGALVVINAFLGQVTAKQIIVAAASALSGQPESMWRCALSAHGQQGRRVGCLLAVIPPQHAKRHAVKNLQCSLVVSSCASFAYL